jgi:hypothetical protein
MEQIFGREVARINNNNFKHNNKIIKEWEIIIRMKIVIV